jgi:hypothetical protein
MVFSTLCRCASLCFLLCSAISANTSRTGTTKSLSFPFVTITEFNKTIALVAMRGGDRAVVEKKTVVPMKWAVASGVLLAFNSGFINGACLSKAAPPPKQAFAAMTGSWTTSAVGFASENIEQFKMQMSVILSYFSGSAIAGAFNPLTFKLSSSTGPRLHTDNLVRSAHYSDMTSDTGTFFGSDCD